MINSYKAHDFSPKSSQNFFFDANVWLFLFCPLGDFGKKKQSEYAELFKNIISVKAGIHLNSLVLSEFCNRYLRLDFDFRKKEFPTIDYKKDYLPSEYYKETADAILAALKLILASSERSNDDFNAINIDIVFSEFKKIDFNDSYYSELVNRRDWILVSDDGDFKNCAIDINLISANNIYFTS